MVPQISGEARVHARSDASATRETTRNFGPAVAAEPTERCVQRHHGG